MQIGRRESQGGPKKDAESLVVSDPEHCTHFLSGDSVAPPQLHISIINAGSVFLFFPVPVQEYSVSVLDTIFGIYLFF